MFISGPVLTLALDGAKKSLMHFRAAICQQSLGCGIRKILVKKTMSETSLSEILDLNGNWLVMQLPVRTINKDRAADKSVRLIILVRIISCNL
jgi:hypothetical protein